MLETSQGPAERDLLQQVCAKNMEFVRSSASSSVALGLERRAGAELEVLLNCIDGNRS